MTDEARGRISRRRFLEVAGVGAAAVAMPGVMAACAQAGSTPATSSSKVAPATLSIFVSKDTAHPQQQMQLMDLIKQTFEKQNPGSSFTWDTYASAAEEQTKLETGVAAREGPDIFEFGSTVVPTAYASGAFETITNSMWDELGGRKAFFQPQLAMSGPSQDKQIGVPWTGNPYAMVINKEMFSAAGIKNPPKTWNEFIDAAKAMTNGKDSWGVAMAPADGFDPWHKIWLFVTQMGAQLMDDTGKKGLLDSDASVQACAFWLDWMANFKIASRQCATYKGADEQKAFAAGNIGMQVMTGPGGIPTYDASAVAGKYEYVVGPTVPYGVSSMPAKGKPAQGFVSGQYLTIFKYSKNKELALNLIKVFTSPDIQYQLFKLRAQQPVVLDTFTKYPDAKVGPWNTLYDAELKAYPTPFFGSWLQLEVVLGQAINSMAQQIGVTGSYSKDALKAALTQANQKLAASIS
jgi:multiple sugar transport system substrate-binding protein